MVGVKEIPANSEIIKSIESEEHISENSQLWQDISLIVESCTVPGLTKPYDEYSTPLEDEYQTFSDKIEKSLSELNIVLSYLNKKTLPQPMNTDFVSTMLLLTEEMKSNGPWYKEYYSKYSNTTIKWFENNCNFYDNEDEHLHKYKNVIFENCMRKIHTKLTNDKWKHHPAALQCYRNVVNNLNKVGKIACPMPLVFPGTLIQLDDYHIENKEEGLKCCASLLANLECCESGYEEVVYQTLTKLLRYKENLIFEGAFECILSILPVLVKNTNDSRWSKCDDIFELILEDLYLETDRQRKETYLKNIPDLIRLSGNSTIRWKNKILHVICDAMDIYLHDSEHYETVNHSIMCLMVWLQTGWPVWCYRKDKEVLTRLFKVLFLLSQEITDHEDMKNNYLCTLQRCIIFILNLCTENERNEVFNDVNIDISKLGEKFCTIWNSIKNNFSEVPTRIEET